MAFPLYPMKERPLPVRLGNRTYELKRSFETVMNHYMNHALQSKSLT